MKTLPKINILESVVILILQCTYVYGQDQFILIKSVAMTLYNIVWVHNPDCENSPGLYVLSASQGSRLNKFHPALEYSAALGIVSRIYV